MKIRGFASALAFCFAIGANAQWTVVNLHPAGATYSHARGASDGQQVGYASVGGDLHAGMWAGSAVSWIDLHPAGAEYSHAMGCSGGQQVGDVDVVAGVGGLQASLWSGTGASRVNLHPAGAGESIAYSVSGGQQVGQASVGASQHASLWTGTAASWVDLNPAGAESSHARGVSGGQQVGFANVGITQRASLWTGTAASWVDLNPAMASGSSAYSVHGTQQVGQATVGGVQRASLWSGSGASWVDVSPPGATWSGAYGLSGGQQVGGATVGGISRASLWRGTSTSWVDLHSFLPSNYSSSEARGIWHDGNATYVVGSGYNTTTNRQEALLWVGPPPSPEGFALSLNKLSVAGQNSVLGTITMVETSPNNRIFTTYDNSSLVTTPPRVTVLAEQLSRNFQITVTAITSTVVTTIYAKRGALTRSQTLTLTPLIPTALVFTPSQVMGGSPTLCRVVINGVAGPGGRVIATFDNSIYATTPSTVIVPAGATDVTFPITTLPVTSIKTVTVTARVSAGEKTGTFRINP